MTKFSEIPEPSRSALKELYFHTLAIKSQEDKDLNGLGVRLLFIANAAGLAVVITFLGTLIQSGKSYETFVSSMKLFFAGAICAALIQIFLMIASSMAMNVLGTQLEQFIRGNIDLEKLRPYGLNRRGKLIVLSLYAFAAVLFFIAVWRAFSGLESL